jgi:hypothetical protein
MLINTTAPSNYAQMIYELPFNNCFAHMFLKPMVTWGTPILGNLTFHGVFHSSPKLTEKSPWSWTGADWSLASQKTSEKDHPMKDWKSSISTGWLIMA